MAEDHRENKAPRHLQGTKLLLEQVLPFDSAVSSLDVNELRIACAKLLDVTAQAVFRRGLDLDDVIVERHIQYAASNHRARRVPLVSLTDRDAIVNSLDPSDVIGARITALVAQVFTNTGASPRP